MSCRVLDMRKKEIINVRDGSRLGFVSDIEFDPQKAVVESIIVLGRLRFFGLLGREDDLVIPWQNIKVIGDDTILVDCALFLPPRKNFSIFKKDEEKNQEEK